MLYAETWHKTRQYHYYLDLLWGKMVSEVNCGTGDNRDLCLICPSLAKQTSVICPQFDEYDIVRITRRYMELYPEHRGYEERLEWIIRCVFGPGCVPMPPAAASIAPYVDQRSPGPVPATPTPGVTVEVPTSTPTPYVVVPPAEPPGEGPPSWLKIAGLAALAYLLLRR